MKMKKILLWTIAIAITIALSVKYAPFDNEDPMEKGPDAYRKEKYVEAVEWFQQAAKWSDIEAQYYLGHCYFNGLGVARDYSKAVKWYRLAALQGNIEAQLIVGRCCENGYGVPKDFTEAVGWYQIAAALENVEAKAALNRLENKK